MADSIRQRHEHQALHLGTYEAAIESMLRKMRDEDAGGVQFWLYRVALRDRTMIKPGYCNETFEDISQITQEGLGDWGAIRYLNTWESPGSISLAVRPQSLAAVQGIPPSRHSAQARHRRSSVRSPGSGIRSARSRQRGKTNLTGWRKPGSAGPHGRAKHSRESPRHSSRPSTRASAS